MVLGGQPPGRVGPRQETRCLTKINFLLSAPPTSFVVNTQQESFSQLTLLTADDFYYNLYESTAC